MVLIKGNLPMPDSMFQIVNAVTTYQKPGSTTKGYLAGFERLIDPVIIGTFFGLYKSKQLPPLDEERIELEKSYEFNVDISSFSETFNHLLFCLWVAKEGLPDKAKDIVAYREALYRFISKLQDNDYYRNVLIPFYLSKADEMEGSESSFLYRLWNSDTVGVELQTYSPEYLALEFRSARDEFLKDMIIPLQRSAIKKNGQYSRSRK